MTIKVKTAYLTTFSMPPSCTTCGQPASPGLFWKIAGTRSDWSGRRTTSLSVEFPLCEACDRVSRSSRDARTLTWVGVLISLGLCLLATLLGGSISGNVFFGLGLGVLLFILAALLFSWLAERLNRKGLSDEERQRRSRVLRCVRIDTFNVPGMFEKNGSIVFAFENQAFALEFLQLNAGQFA